MGSTSKTLDQIEAETGRKLSLSDWLKKIFEKGDDSLLIDYEFPTPRHEQEYLESISSRSDKEVIELLRKFLFPSCSFNQNDEFRLGFLLQRLKENPKKEEKHLQRESTRRLLAWHFTNKTRPTFDGIRWTIDLLPNSPRQAIDAINAYLIAHFMILPDGRITGLCDAMSVIRAKFIQTIPGNARDALSTLNPREFEQVVAELYAGMRYEITLTKATRDGGRDVIAEKNTAGSKERALIDCKLYNKSQVGREQVSKLLGTVSNERATKGVIVTTGHVTKGAQEFNPRIEVIKFEQLCRLFNEFFGSSWAYRLDEIILANIRRNEKPLKDSNSAN